MSTSDNPSAFPRKLTSEERDGVTVFFGEDGMTLRDWFAGQALTGWLASYDADQSVKAKSLAEFAYGVADAMLEARKKK